jgi:hypothetical protein
MAASPKPTTLPAAQYGGGLVIFTSFYEQRGYAGYIKSLVTTQMVLERLGIRYDYWAASGDFHVERALNKALTNFMRSDFTDFINIDADEAWDPEGLMRILLNEEEIVGGSYRMKNRWGAWTATPRTVAGVPDGKLKADGEPLIAAERLPAGFLRIKKTALEKFAAAYPERWYWDTHDETKERIKVVQFFTTSLRDHEMFSQDFTFSEDMKAIGVPLWIEPNVTIGHFGLVEHVGNLDRHLRQLKEDQGMSDMQVIERFAAREKEPA